MPNNGHTNDQVTNIQIETSDDLPELQANFRTHFNSKIDESADNYHQILQHNDKINYVDLFKITNKSNEIQNSNHFTYVSGDSYTDYVSGYESSGSFNYSGNKNGYNYVSHFRDDTQNTVFHFNSHNADLDI